MQTSQTIFPIIHPKRLRRPNKSWKHKGKRVSQYRIVSM